METSNKSIIQNKLLKDTYKSEEYYLNELERVNNSIARFDENLPSSNSNHERISIILNSYLLKKIRIFYLLNEKPEEIKKFILEYCDNLSKKSNLTYNEITTALSFVVLYDLNVHDLIFIKDKMIDEKYADATLDLLRNYVFENKIGTAKDFYFKEKGYFKDEFTKDKNGLLKTINAPSEELRNEEFLKFLKEVKEKHHQRLLKYYDSIGEKRYTYAGAFDFKLTAIAKILCLDKTILENSKFIASDLLP